MTLSRKYRPRIVVVDDHQSVLRALCRLLGVSCDVVASADNGQQAIEAAVTLTPDVMVVDLTMLEMNGLEICRRVKEVAPTTDIIILTAFDDAQMEKVAFEAGASAFVAKYAAASGVLESTIQHLVEKKQFGP